MSLVMRLAILSLFVFSVIFSCYVWKMNGVASHLVWDYPPTKQFWPTTGYSLFPMPYTPHDFPPGFSFTQVNTSLDATDAFIYENLIETSALVYAAIALWIPTALLTIFEIAKSRKGAHARAVYSARTSVRSGRCR